MAWLAGALLVLNLLDGVLTWVGLELGAVTEANPLLSWAWRVSPVAVALFKVVGVSVLVLAIVAAHKPSWVPVAMRYLVAVYAVVLFLHLRWLTASTW